MPVVNAAWVWPFFLAISVNTQAIFYFWRGIYGRGSPRPAADEAMPRRLDAAPDHLQSVRPANADKEKTVTTFSTAREIPASIEQVFAAISDPQRLARWWGPSGFTN